MSPTDDNTVNHEVLRLAIRRAQKSGQRVPAELEAIADAAIELLEIDARMQAEVAASGAKTTPGYAVNFLVKDNDIRGAW